MNSRKTLYVFRHGETDWNRARRMQGSTDIPLNELGRSQAQKLREYFRENPVEAFFSSDLSRARETAEIAAGDLNVPIHVDAGIRETNLGDAEGLTQAEIAEKFGAQSLESWYAMGPGTGNFRFPRGETKNEHLARVMAAMEKFLRAHPYKRVGVATHGGVLRRVIHHLRPELTELAMIGNCSVYEMTFESDSGLWSIDLDVKCAW